MRTSFVIFILAIIFHLVACTTKQQLVFKVSLPQALAKSVKSQKNIQTFKLTTFSKIPGWEKDDIRDVWPAFMLSCSVLIKRPLWKTICNKAYSIHTINIKVIRQFFEKNFVPYQVYNLSGSDVGLVTGYYEPMLYGARERSDLYQIPLYKVPNDLLRIDLTRVFPALRNVQLRGRIVGSKIVPYYSRAELLQSNMLFGKELVWVDNLVDAFFLQIQGSGRIYLQDTKETIRVVYADQNGHPYRSIGRYLIDKKEISLSQASAEGIKIWLIENPTRQQELFNVNPHYVFFKEEKIADLSQGPKGAMGLSLTHERSIAVDPNYIPLGTPVFLATTQPNSKILLQRLMLAQDTGDAIRGAVRADYFWGFGNEAAKKASAMKQLGKMWILQPK